MFSRRLFSHIRSCVAVVGLVAVGHAPARAADSFELHQFERQQLTDVYYSEGANFGDVDHDGKPDIVHGPFWFKGPDFKTKHEIYPAKAQPRERYADNFFSWVYDFNGDGWQDVFTVGFPGTPAYVYENPTDKGFDKPWPKHTVFDQVGNESPHFTNIVGDERPELVCTVDGFWGYATIDWKKPLGHWTFHPVSEAVAPKPFGHGLGVGDVDGDAKLDILTKDGWYQQPAKLDGDPKWPFFAAPFARAGGAEMYAYDVDGDGDNDVITSLQAHEFGLAWYEQLKDGDKRVFKPHVIMGSTPAENRYGVLFSELHSVNLADIDGDGLKDIITGKTYWSHHTQSPMWDAGAVVYWFKLSRGKDGVDWIPHLADSDSGIGRQVIIGDVNGDKVPDIVAGGMKGCHVLTHIRKQVSKDEFEAAQPKPRRDMANGLKPADAAQHMTVPPGFRVQLAAGEPQVHQPVAMALDVRGRVWVAEAYTYPIRAPEGQGKDRIIILEDTDGDGTLDNRKVFAEKLNLVSGLEVGFGGAWVGAAPYLLFIPDKDADDLADSEPQVLLDGFGFHDTHETLNSFIWGPDGWLYGCHGVFTRSKVGKPGTPDDQRVPVNAAIWRYHPTRQQFQVFAGGTSNPWGVDFDEHGQAFCTACVIPHLFHVIHGGRYQRQAGQHFNPYTFDDIKTIADHAHYTGDIQNHAWWGHEPTELASGTNAAGGGHAHCGAMIYLGDNWPASYRNQIYFNNVHGNRVNHDVMERQGSGFVGRHGKDLLLANDHWFRGINLRYGPDGSVFLIDWYDPNACHRVNPEIWDRTNGRVYRISYGSPKPVKVDLSRMTDAELVGMMTHSNEWYVRMARKVLQERAHAARNSPADKSLAATLHETPDALRKIATADADPKHRLRALWTLHAIACATSDDYLKQIASDDEYLRSWSIQLICESTVAAGKGFNKAVLEKFATLAKDDPSPVVRLYLASALQQIPVDNRWPIAEALLAHAEDAKDHNLPLMYWYGTEPLVPADPGRALELATASKIPLLAGYIVRRAASDNSTLDRVVSAAAATKDTKWQLTMLTEILRAFEGRVNIPAPPSWNDAYGRLSSSTEAQIRDRADEMAVVMGDRRIFPPMRKTLVDASAPREKRKQALDILVRGRDADAAGAFQAVLSDPALRGPALRALAMWDDKGTPKAVLAAYGSLSDDERRDAMSTLVSRPPFAMALLDAVQAQKLPRTELHAYHVRQLLEFKDDKLTARIREVWGDIRETKQDKLQEITKLKERLGKRQLAAADTTNGRRVFNKTCATCHVLFGEGTKVGPDITGSNRANLDYLLENVVDPSAVLGKDYRMTVIACSDGRVVSGMVQKETDSALTLRTINDTIVVAKADVDQQTLSEQSLMPERLLDPLRPEEVRDLVAYLGSPSQVPLQGPRSPIDTATKKVRDAIEGESIKVLSKTAGDAGGQKMEAFTKDAWSGNDQLWWTGAKPGAKLEVEIPVKQAGRYVLETVLTKARDYGIVQLKLDGRPLGGPIDLFNSPDVITTGVLEFDGLELQAGAHRLGVEIVGANPASVKAYMFGLDYIRLRSQ